MSAERDPHQGGALQHDAEHERPHKKNSVLFYLMILFAAAFLLLLLSYFMQQRANQEALDDLEQTSNSAVESLENLIAERDALKLQVSALEAERDTLQAEWEASADTAQKARDGLMAVSYTHLDVYKRQPWSRQAGARAISSSFLGFLLNYVRSGFRYHYLKTADTAGISRTSRRPPRSWI